MYKLEILLIISIVTAFILTYFVIPPIIHVAKSKNLCDEPGERRSHTESTPSLGGVGIFAGLIFSITLWTPIPFFSHFQYIFCAFIIIFLIGVKDDISPVAPLKKLLGQLFAACILVFKANIKLSSLYGIFGIFELSPFISASLSIFTILVIINAFNLIDGINGLSGSVGVLISSVLGIWFYLVGQIELAFLAGATAGATAAFLKYNYTPAKIFMGDTGALLLGLVSSILTIHFIEMHRIIPFNPYSFSSAPAVAIGILILPLFDTLRVFITRIIKGKSPLHPDRTHIHHLLIDAGLSHTQATAILLFVNVAFIVMVICLQHIGNLNLLILLLVLATALSSGLHYSVKRKKQLSRV